VFFFINFVIIFSELINFAANYCEKVTNKKHHYAIAQKRL